MQILVVDDSVAYRSLLKQVLQTVPSVTTIAAAANGKIALQKLEQGRYDLVVCDIEMPEMNGIETVKNIRQMGFSDLPIIMFSSVTKKSAGLTLDALHAGASDVVAKPDSNIQSIDDSIAYVEQQLVPKILQFVPDMPTKERSRETKSPSKISRPGILGQTSNKMASEYSRISLNEFASVNPELVVIASSTGGPPALEKLFMELSLPSCPPILIVQHMPPMFTRMLADRLNGLCKFSVKEAGHGDILVPGCVYIAPGDYHMEVSREPKLKINLNQNPKENSCRPAADPLFRSAAKVCGKRCVGIVLTGMGEDGMLGTKAIKEVGGPIFIQNKESCTVWGMPASVYREGSYDVIGDIDDCRNLLTILA